LRGPAQADEATSHAVKRIAVAVVDTNTAAAKLQPM
jgi:hypothetical protein